MSGEPNAESGGGGGQEGFTCCALLMCLYQPGLSKKKPEEAMHKNPPPAETTGPAPGPPADQQQQVPSRAASLYSGNNIVFDFAVEERDQEEEQGAARAIQFQGYCPSPCFDLPLELIRAGERPGAAADSDAPVTAAFVFGGDGQRGGGALKKMASCLAPGVEGSSEPEPRPPHLLRFLSASGRCSSVPRPPVMPSRTSPLGKAVDGDCDLGESMMVPACNE